MIFSPNRRYNYLGEDEALLNARQSCPPVGNPDFIANGLPLASAVDRGVPKVAGIDDTRAVVFYAKIDQTVLYYRVVTIDANGTPSWLPEQTLISGTVFASYGVCPIRDGKILLIYKNNISVNDTIANVGTIDAAGAMTFATPTVLNSTMAPDTARAWYDVRKVSEGRAFLAATSNANSQPHLQVIDVDASDVITFGTAVSGTSTNTATPKIALLTPTKGVYCAAGLFSNLACTAEEFNVSGSTVTFTGVVKTFTDNVQYPAPWVDHFFIGDVAPFSGDSFGLFGNATLDNGLGAPVYHALSSNTVTDVSAVMSAPAPLEDTTSVDFDTSPTSQTMSVQSKANSFLVLHMSNSNTVPQTINLTRHLRAGTNVYAETFELASNTLARHPDNALVGSDSGVNVWAESDGVDEWVAVSGMHLTDPSPIIGDSAVAIAAAGVGYFTGGQARGLVSDVTDYTPNAATTKISLFTGASSLVASADLSAARYGAAACGNADKGFFSGGGPEITSDLTTTDRLTYSTDTTATVVGADLTQARKSCAGVGDSTKGFVSGGRIGSDNAGVVTTDKNTYVTEVTTAVVGADLVWQKYGLAAAGDNTAGFFMNGSSSARTIAQLKAAVKTTYSTETSALVATADLVHTDSRYASGGGNLETGYFLAGIRSFVWRKWVDVTTYATDTTAAGADSLFPFTVSGCAGNLLGGFMGGDPVTRMDYTLGVTYLAAGTTLPPLLEQATAVSTGIFT